jgi:hypothetical protein
VADAHIGRQISSLGYRERHNVTPPQRRAGAA